MTIYLQILGIAILAVVVFFGERGVVPLILDQLKPGCGFHQQIRFQLPR